MNSYANDHSLISHIKEKCLRKENINELADKDLSMLINHYCNEVLIDFGAQTNIEDLMELSRQVFFSIRGLGALENLILDDEINEIMVNDLDHIFIERKGVMQRSEIKIHDMAEYNRIIQKIVSDAGREVNLSNPIVDCRLADGSRVNIILPPIALKYPVVTIRKFPSFHINMDFLVTNHTIDDPTCKFLSDIVKAKYNILIGGGTSSGKTSFLNALSGFISPDERVVTIEDSRELQLNNIENLISLETRNANTSNRGRIEIKDLIKNALRMRPDRIIVGEVRSDETIDMLQAMNTGHEGSITTAHANGTNDMISRLETLVLRSKEQIPIEAVRRMIGSSLEIIIQLARLGPDKRRVVEISEIYLEDDKIMINKLYEYDMKEDRLFRNGNPMRNKKKLEDYESFKKF